MPFSRRIGRVLLVVAAAAASIVADSVNRCSLNGVAKKKGGREICVCDDGWKGESCNSLNLKPATPSAFGLRTIKTPTWGGSAVPFRAKGEKRKWHLIVGSRAASEADDSKEDYPCDSQIVRAVSTGDDPMGPYTIEEVLFNRSSWEPGLTIGPGGELVMLFFGNMSNPPPVGSPDCVIGNGVYNVTTTTTYITVSHSGSPKGPWTEPQFATGMENSLERGRERRDPFVWSCASGNPSPAFHPNGTLYAAMRQNPCWKGFQTREHIGLWRADDGWDGTWTLVTSSPLFGWGGGSERNCSDRNACPSHEDPHLWIDDRGFHLLTHDQSNPKIHSTRGGYGWSDDGLRWTLETPTVGNTSAWDMELFFSNGTQASLARRQRPSFIRDARSGAPTHLITGADFSSHMPKGPGVCEGCHWGQGFTLIQELNKK